MSKVDILYLAKGRDEFTQASVDAFRKNTTGLIERIGVFTDGAAVSDAFAVPFPCRKAWCDTDQHGGPVAIMNRFLADPFGSDLFVKIDNDVIVPPGWLDAAMSVMEENPKLDILGLEPAYSRMPNPTGRLKHDPYCEPDNRLRCGLCGSSRITIWGYAPDECNDCHAWSAPGGWLPSGEKYVNGVYSRKYYRGYAKVRSVGGVFIARRAAFENRPPMKPAGPNGVGGFTSWQLDHTNAQAEAIGQALTIGWIVPQLKLFLLDRLPFEPWLSLSRKYMAEGIQRPWTMYADPQRGFFGSPSDGDTMYAYHLWDWWTK